MRSNYERMFAKRLDALGVRYEYEAYRLSYELPVQGAYCRCCEGRDVVRVGWYTPDFYLPDHGLFLETKGEFTSQDRSKMLAVAEDHPEENIVLVFMADNKLSKNSTTRYSEWAIKHCIPQIVVGKPNLPHFELSDLPLLLPK